MIAAKLIYRPAAATSISRCPTCASTCATTPPRTSEARTMTTAAALTLPSQGLILCDICCRAYSSPPYMPKYGAAPKLLPLTSGGRVVARRRRDDPSKTDGQLPLELVWGPARDTEGSSNASADR